MSWGRHGGRLQLVITGLVVGIFALDCVTPLGYEESVLYLVPLLLTSWSGKTRYTVVLAAICTVLIAIGFFVSPQGASPMVDLVDRSMGVAVAWIATLLLVQRQRAEEEARRSGQQLRALATRLQGVREEERTRIARELHDELGQAMTGLNIDLAWTSKQLAKLDDGVCGAVRDRIAEMMKLINGTIQSVRRICTELRPGLLDDLGLVAAIEWQAHDFQSRSGIACEVRLPEDAMDLGREASTAVFRIFQEILTNVARHANATKVNVTLYDDGGKVALEVRDNGRGIKETEIWGQSALGLLGMRERAFLFGGEVSFVGVPGQGTRVTITVPRLTAGLNEHNENTDCG